MLLASADTPWVAVGSIATAFLALATFFAVNQGRREQMQIIIDRELIWRPALSGRDYGRIILGLGVRPNNDVSRRPVLTNAGGGPALSARFIWKSMDSWYLSSPVDVPASGETGVSRGQKVETQYAGQILESIGPHASEMLCGAIFCRDFLDRRWCFPIAGADEGLTAVLSPHMWRPSDGSRTRPTWATDYSLWPG